MRYAIAYMNLFDNDLKLTTVEADNPVTAIVEGARELMGVSDDVDKWLNPMVDNIQPSDDYAARIEEIKGEFFNADQVVAVMPI